MTHLDTLYPTIVFDYNIIDPSIMDNIVVKGNKKRINQQFYYKDKHNPYLSFVCDIASEFLNMNHFNHNKQFWYMDVIRYDLDNQKKGVSSGLAWHCENDNYDNLITVLFYLRMDENIKDGNLRYKDKDNVNHMLEIKSGTTVIMDGEVPHKPQNPYGTGKRDLIIVSFKKD
jgi:hypothetical protein